MAKPITMQPGEIYGLLRVVDPSSSRQVLCVCRCGNWKTIKAYSLRAGYTRSCGCLRSIPTAHKAKYVAQPDPMTMKAKRREALDIIRTYRSFLADPLRMAAITEPEKVEAELISNCIRLNRDYGPFTKKEIYD